MTTTVSMARPTIGADHPTREEQPMHDNRPADRLIDAINLGHIYRRPDYSYGDRRNESRDVTDLLYELYDRGWVDLFHDGSVLVNGAGQEWRDRPRKTRTPAVTADPFNLTGAAA
jgi:hypothetical protein